jgi:hypothetical protein
MCVTLSAWQVNTEPNNWLTNWWSTNQMTVNLMGEKPFQKVQNGLVGGDGWGQVLQLRCLRRAKVTTQQMMLSCSSTALRMKFPNRGSKPLEILQASTYRLGAVSDAYCSV